MNIVQPFAILKWTVSAATSSSRAALCSKSPRVRACAEIVGQLQEGEVREGVVKNITDYGALLISAASMACCTSPT